MIFLLIKVLSDFFIVGKGICSFKEIEEELQPAWYWIKVTIWCSLCDKEIATLLAEIGTLDAKENKDLIDSKTAKLEGLNGILSVLYAEENITKDGAFDRRKVGKLRGAFEKYVQKLAKSNDSFSDPDKVSEALKKIVDYRELKGRAIAYNKSIPRIHE